MDTFQLIQTVADMGQSVVKLLNAWHNTNCNLQQQLNQSATTQQHKVDALHELTAPNYQRNFNHMFASMPTKD